MVQSWPSAAPHVQPSPWTASPQPSQTPLRTKRRHEPEDEDRDERMDRSPTPERPRRAVPKRARIIPAAISSVGKEQQHTAKENKPPSQSEENDVDVGFLLATLPPQSLLPLLTSLISAQPSLKPTILSLIPRPTLDAALQGLANSAQKLKDAYPYSTSLFLQSPQSSFSNPGGFGSSRSSTASFSAGFGFGARAVGGTGLGSASSSAPNGGMREEYIVSRLRPHIQEFVSACLSYLPYFSIAVPSEPALSSRSQTAQSHASTLRQQHKDKLHPTETYLFLAALTSHILAQPPLTQESLAPMLASRLAVEWRSWVDRVDETVNREGGMFGRETVQTWERSLDEFAQAKGNGMAVMKDIRDRWVSKVGWLVGRQPVHPMEEL
ncbi:hypothetical protein GSI_06394 [Ganoderma sinense ZZ0214-1]|uniref:Tethering factor for nuclear proteasome STS1 n=1 Tax=Ganoderma sinense ZZ0214-1 TaxID=1077348 RepID=A0A2G8SD69_9APHY|nr:hypothetical protein GSI_06394 [Ganoderma sinense ZZ0214-1]